MAENLVTAREVVKTYGTGNSAVNAVDGLSFEVEEGEFTVVLGPSGAGKTTLLNLVGGMDTVTSGDLLVGGVNLRGAHRAAAHRLPSHRSRIRVSVLQPHAESHRA